MGLLRVGRRAPRAVKKVLAYVILIGCVLFLVPTILNYGGNHAQSSKENADLLIISKRDIEAGGNKKAQSSDWPYGGKDAKKKDWTDHAQEKRDAERTGPGEQGAPYKVATDSETKAKEDRIYRVNGYDGYVSDFIALNRSVKDIRHPDCKKLKYLEKLPTASVILATHNEHWSVLLRSCHSIVHRTPPELLKEIIIVDDRSTKEFLKKRLDDYVKQNLPKVRVIHTDKREGLIRARQIGAQQATGEVMVFLDAHSEPNFDWMPPLLEPIANDYKTVVCPFVDIIDCDTFEYRAQDEGARGSWDWEFNYKRLPVLKKNQKLPTDPFDSPVMAGGYFAISSKWFWELGGYDEGLDIWGGEQYELSFKIWQCHGRMVDVPCSRVGHIYRCKHVPFANPGVGDFISRNYKRVAEVWMDEYKEFLYEKRPSMRNTDAGDMSKQLAVRERLKCKSFKWFMTEVAYDQDLYYPAREPIDGAKGRLKCLASSSDKPLCVDGQYRENVPLKLSPCGNGDGNFRYTWFRDIRADGRTSCFDASTSVKRAPVVLFSCHSLMGNQHWQFDPAKKQIFHPISGQCLDADLSTQEVFMNPCDASLPSQQWQFSQVNMTVLNEWRQNPRSID